jgi:hypothetical protein
MVAGTLLCACLAACSSEPKAPPPVAPPAGAPQAQAAAPPLDPARLAELKASLDQLQELIAGVQGASPQGRARLVQQQLQTFLDSADPQKKLPFRKNLVKILSETTGDELSDSQKQAIRQEIQAIQRELGLQDTSSSGSQGPAVVPPPPGGPGGPAPGGPGPGPGGPGPGGPGGPAGPGPGGPGPGGPPHPGPPAP